MPLGLLQFILFKKAVPGFTLRIIPLIQVSHLYFSSCFRRSSKDFFKSSSKKIPNSLFQSFRRNFLRVLQKPLQEFSNTSMFSETSPSILIWIALLALRFIWNRSKILPGIISENLLMPTSMVLIRDLTLSFSKNLSRTFHPLITIAFFPNNYRAIFQVKSPSISQNFIRDYTPANTTAIFPTIYALVSSGIRLNVY